MLQRSPDHIVHMTRLPQPVTVIPRSAACVDVERPGNAHAHTCRALTGASVRTSAQASCVEHTWTMQQLPELLLRYVTSLLLLEQSSLRVTEPSWASGVAIRAQLVSDSRSTPRPASLS